jgi:PTS system mannose-specific IIA component
MIGIVVATHQKFGEELIRAAEGIVGPMEQVEAVSFHYEESPDVIRQRLMDAVERVDAGQGVLIFTDMFGGTPTNLSLPLMRRSDLDILAGVNLPMLLKAQSARKEMDITKLSAFIRDYGIQNIVIASDYFGCPRSEGS